ncbi:MAG TPA: crossover junction endodeoxyribonuclease RuvC [bacterium]|nr:crossover junction endodeoxyribonuclease RuvC [bacterium]
MRILGIDPGLRLTGYGLVEVTGSRVAFVEAGVIRTSLRAALPERLYELHVGVHEILVDGRPAAIALEDVFAHPGFPRTAIIMGHVCGVIGLAAAQARVPVDTIAPAAVKRAMVVSGQAGKRQIQRMVRILLDLAEDPGSHAADALALALVAASRRGAALQTAGGARAPA